MKFLVCLVFTFITVDARHLHKRVYIESDRELPPHRPLNLTKFFQHFVQVDAPFVSVRTGGGVGGGKSVSVDAPFVSVRTSAGSSPQPQPATVNVNKTFVANKRVSVDAPFVSVRTSSEKNKSSGKSPQNEIAPAESNKIEKEAGFERKVQVTAPFTSVSTQNGQVQVRAPFTSVSRGNVNVDLSSIFSSAFNIVDVVAPFTNVRVSG